MYFSPNLYKVGCPRCKMEYLSVCASGCPYCALAEKLGWDDATFFEALEGARQKELNDIDYESPEFELLATNGERIIEAWPEVIG